MSSPRPEFRHLCTRCGKPISWVKTSKGKRVPIDMPHPKVEGKIWLTVWGNELQARFLGRDAQDKPLRPGALTYTCHFDTCPKKTEAKVCPVDQCQNVLRAREVFCATHWERLGAENRSSITRLPRGGDAQQTLVKRALEQLNVGSLLSGGR
jgi:hypothetical protein